MPTLYSMVNEIGNRNRILEMYKFQIWFRLLITSTILFRFSSNFAYGSKMWSLRRLLFVRQTGSSLSILEMHWKTNKGRHSRQCSCSCYKNSKESRCDHRQHAVLRQSHQQRLQSSSVPHSSSASHPPLCVSRWRKDGGECDGVIPAGLMELHPVRHIFI